MMTLCYSPFYSRLTVSINLILLWCFLDEFSPFFFTFFFFFRSFQFSLYKFLSVLYICCFTVNTSYTIKKTSTCSLFLVIMAQRNNRFEESHRSSPKFCFPQILLRRRSFLTWILGNL